ncbi:MAG: hypothetical protein ACXWAT_00060 [Methylobacter sp.]
MNILIQGTTILAIDPLIDTGSAIKSADAIYPKSVIPGWQIVQATLPADYAPGKYSYSAGVFTLNSAPTQPVIVPQSVSRFQALAALTNAGLYTAAQNAVTSAGGLTLLAWNNAISFERNSPTIASLATALGLTSAQLDALFIAAAKITA